MNFDRYRGLRQKILLTKDGCAPTAPLSLTQAEQDAAFSRIACTYDLVERIGAHCRLGNQPTVPTGAEIWRSQKVWFLSHALFIPQFSLIAHSLDRAIGSSEAANREAALRWVRIAASMRRCCGSLFLYGVDFAPCKSIYCESIRKSMPDGFSGYWIRERQHALQPAMVRFLSSFPATPAGSLAETMRGTWGAADRSYHELHGRAMLLAVADGNSLADQYRKDHGKAHEITEQEFDIYDEWFRIERAEEVSRLDYIFQVCDIIEQIAGDLMAGHRLEAPVVRDLIDGMTAALVVFGNWVGPVREG